MNEQNKHAALTIAQQYPPAQYNLLVPMQTVTEIADIQKPVMNSVSISTNLNDGEIYGIIAWALRESRIRKPAWCRSRR